MFSLLSQNKFKKETSLVFIIESGKIISAVIKFNDSKSPEIFYTHRANITYQQDVNPERLEDLMLSTLKSSAEKVLKEAVMLFKQNGFHKINTYIILGSLWYRPVHLKSEKKEAKEFTIDESLIKKISEEKIEDLKDQTIIEHKIISVKANGYNITNIYNQKAKELLVNSLISTVSKKLLGQIESMINLSIIHTNFIYHTTAQAIFPQALELANKADFIIFIPEHEVSDLIIVRKGNIEKIVSIPFGKHSPVRALSPAFKDDKTSAHSVLTLYLEGKLEKDANDRIKTLLDLSKSKFQDVLRDALWELSSTIFLPEDIVVSDGHPISKLLGEWIHTEEFSSKTMTIKSFNVYFMQNQDIMNKVIAEKKVDYINPLLVSVCLYLKSI